MQIFLSNNLDSIKFIIPQLIISACILFQFGLNLISKNSTWHLALTLFFLGLALLFSIIGPNTEIPIFNHLFIYNKLCHLSTIIILALSVTLLPLYFFDKRIKKSPLLPELLMVFSGLILSGLFLIQASNWISFVVCFESVAIASYLLFLLSSNDNKSIEASYKYFLFGLISSALMFTGVGLMYLGTGYIHLFETNFLVQLSTQPDVLIQVAFWLFFIGFFFKLSLVPFHFWAPDVYEAGSNAVIATIAIIPKLCSFVFLYRFISQFTYEINGYMLVWPKFDFINNIGAILCLTIILSNTAILRVYSFKRILAYAGMSQLSLLTFLLLIFSQQAFAFGLYFFVAYALGTILVFVSNTLLENKYKTYHIEQYTGLGHKSFFIGIFLLIGLVSFIGLPGTIGFTAKFFVFTEAIQYFALFQHQTVLIIIILSTLASVISVFYYLKLPLAYFFRGLPPRQRALEDIHEPGFFIYAGFLALAIIILGIFPDWMINHLQFEYPKNLFVFP